MKFVVFLACCLVAAFLEPASSHPITKMDELAKPFEKLIKNEIHGILEMFFKLIKELIGNVTDGQSPPTSTTSPPQTAEEEESKTLPPEQAVEGRKLKKL